MNLHMKSKSPATKAVAKVSKKASSKKVLKKKV
jgi:hypothetical protein